VIGTETSVHPAAALFPMLAAEELADLADDIRANGLLHPIVLDPDGVLIDGRNRLAACRLAGVEPSFTTYDGDPLALIYSANIQRRNLTKGQTAMAIARMLDLSEGRYNGARALTFAAKVSESRISYAVAVLKYAPDLIDQVMAGRSLDEAYEVALERKRQRDADLKALRRLRATYPDLAGRVEADQIRLVDALAAADLLDRARSLRDQVGRAYRQIELRRESIGALSLPDPDLSTLAVPAPGPTPVPPTAGEVMAEIAAEIDEAGLDRTQDILDRLRLLDRLTGLIQQTEPTRMADHLNAGDAAYVADTLRLVLRWVYAAERAATRSAEPGHLAVVS
jgi:hypothetical protein